MWRYFLHTAAHNISQWILTLDIGVGTHCSRYAIIFSLIAKQARRHWAAPRHERLSAATQSELLWHALRNLRMTGVAKPQPIIHRRHANQWNLNSRCPLNNSRNLVCNWHRAALTFSYWGKGLEQKIRISKIFCISGLAKVKGDMPGRSRLWSKMWTP